jgi:RNA polymerase sigma-70 factor (ECF subfamily)
MLPPDGELVTWLQAGDDDAFALVVDAWSSGMLRLAGTFVSNSESAGDVLQETWLAVIRSIGTFEGRSSLKTWVYRILVNTAKRYAAREGRVLPWSSLSDQEAQDSTVDPMRFQGPDDPHPGHWRAVPAPWPGLSPEGEVLAGEISSEVAAALGQLPDRQRIVITLRDVEGLTTDEVGAILNISEGYQRVLLHRARAFVRSKLERYFATAGDKR